MQEQMQAYELRKLERDSAKQSHKYTFSDPVTRGESTEERESDFASLSVINEMDRGEETQSAFKGTIPEN
jgi:hypothetical protein